MDTEHRFNGERAISDLEAMLAVAEDAQRLHREKTEREQQLLRMLRACYNKALKDAETKLPSYLHAALENAMTLIREQGGPHPVFADTLAAICPTADDIDRVAAINAYVELGIQKDRLARHEGRPDQDRDIAGRPLKAGS